jgi:hypothetical protein
MLDARQIAHALRGEVVGRDRVLAPSPGHSAKDRSLSIKIAPSHPDGILVYSFTMDNWQEYLDYVFRTLGIERHSWGSGYPTFPPPAVEPDRQVSSDNALRLWHEAKSPRGTLVARYLASRGLELPDTDAIRFHAVCPFGKGQRHPCMVGLFRDIRTNEPKAIHRTALTPDGKKIGPKVLGPKAGCAVKLTPDEEVGAGLTIGEGIETTIGGMMQMFRPAWALGDAGEVAKFPVLAGIECLTILVDNDENGKGQRSAIECSRRWTDVGREVLRVVPDKIGDDMADCIHGRAT